MQGSDPRHPLSRSVGANSPVSLLVMRSLAAGVEVTQIRRRRRLGLQVLVEFDFGEVIWESRGGTESGPNPAQCHPLECPRPHCDDHREV